MMSEVVPILLLTYVICMYILSRSRCNMGRSDGLR